MCYPGAAAGGKQVSFDTLLTHFPLFNPLFIPFCEHRAAAGGHTGICRALTLVQILIKFGKANLNPKPKF
jgi:hypothetical protein